jgi:hypothetical protein
VIVGFRGFMSFTMGTAADSLDDQMGWPLLAPAK